MDGLHGRRLVLKHGVRNCFVARPGISAGELLLARGKNERSGKPGEQALDSIPVTAGRTRCGFRPGA